LLAHASNSDYSVDNPSKLSKTVHYFLNDMKDADFFLKRKN